MSEWFLPLAAFLVGLTVGVIVWLVRSQHAQTRAEALKIELAELRKEREADIEKLEWTQSAEANMRDAFEALASKALKDNSSQLTERARGEIDSLLNPLSKNLSNLEGQVKELEARREKAYGSLSQQLKHLGEMHGALQQTTTTLAQALKSPTVRGRWGELQLRRVVELSGMSDHVDFDEQAEGQTGRPDMIVHLPNRGVLPIDSKVPLESYLDAMESTEPEIRAAKLVQHAKAMRARVRELGLKSYWDQFEKAPDFVVMFVPNESCLGAAFEKDADLLEYAIGNRVLVSSPVNLLALLRTVAYGWQQHQVTENALKIAREGQELHKRISTFIDYLNNLGQAIKRSVDQYNSAVRSLEGRLLPAVRRFEEMGAAVKEIDPPEPVEVEPRLPLGGEASGTGDEIEEPPGPRSREESPSETDSRTY